MTGLASGACTVLLAVASCCIPKSGVATKDASKPTPSLREIRRMGDLIRDRYGFFFFAEFAVFRLASSCARNFAIRPISFTGTASDKEKRSVPLLTR